MKEKFEERFVKRIKEVQENHDIPYDPKNWLKLQEKRKRKKEGTFYGYTDVTL